MSKNENSVLLALAELHRVETERRSEEAAIEAEHRRREAERIQQEREREQERARHQQRLADAEATLRAAEAQREREEAQRAEALIALRAELAAAHATRAVLTERLSEIESEQDRTVRAQVRRPLRFAAAWATLCGVVTLVLGGALLAETRRPPRVVTVQAPIEVPTAQLTLAALAAWLPPAPAPAPKPGPVAAEAPAPRRPEARRPPRGPAQTAAPHTINLADCGDDPLCGVKLR